MSDDAQEIACDRITVRRSPGLESHPVYPWRAHYPCCSVMHKTDGWSGGWPSWRGVMSQVASHIDGHRNTP